MKKTQQTIQFWALLILSNLARMQQETVWSTIYLILALITFLFLVFSTED